MIRASNTVVIGVNRGSRSHLCDRRCLQILDKTLGKIQVFSGLGPISGHDVITFRIIYLYIQVFDFHESIYLNTQFYEI